MSADKYKLTQYQQSYKKDQELLNQELKVMKMDKEAMQKKYLSE